MNNSTAKLKEFPEERSQYTILVRWEDVEHLPPLYRALAQHLIETGDQRIKIIDNPEAARG